MENEKFNAEQAEKDIKRNQCLLDILYRHAMQAVEDRNVDDLIDLLKNKKYDGINKKILENLIKDNYENKNDKYIKYFYKINANRR